MQTRFRAIAPAARVLSGAGALSALPDELRRLRAGRAFLLSGRSVSRGTPLLDELRRLLGPLCAGSFDELDRHASIASVERAAQAARDAQADCLVAVGAGSVCMAARAVAIRLAESGPWSALVTQYRGDEPPASPRLLAPKLPIMNVLTAATAAQNGAGATLKSPVPGQRLELFDPKTRAAAIFWDDDALATAPASLAHSSGLAVLWWSLMRIGGVAAANPLVQGDRRSSLRLAQEGMNGLGGQDDRAARIALCAASYLHNRDADHGGRPFEVHWVARVCYALGAGVFAIDDGIPPALAYIALTGPAIAHFGARDPDAMRDLLGATAPAAGNAAAVDTGTARPEPSRVRASVEAYFAALGARPRLREFGLAQDSFDAVVALAATNFNADRQREFKNHTNALSAVLRDAW